VITNILTDAGRSGKKVSQLIVTIRNTSRSLTRLPLLLFLAPGLLFSSDL
jgi:hypothetical protein